MEIRPDFDPFVEASVEQLNRCPRCIQGQIINDWPISRGGVCLQCGYRPRSRIATPKDDLEVSKREKATFRQLLARDLGIRLRDLSREYLDEQEKGIDNI